MMARDSENCHGGHWVRILLWLLATSCLSFASVSYNHQKFSIWFLTWGDQNFWNIHSMTLSLKMCTWWLLCRWIVQGVLSWNPMLDALQVWKLKSRSRSKAQNIRFLKFWAESMSPAIVNSLQKLPHDLCKSGLQNNSKSMADLKSDIHCAWLRDGEKNMKLYLLPIIDQACNLTKLVCACWLALSEWLWKYMALRRIWCWIKWSRSHQWGAIVPECHLQVLKWRAQLDQLGRKESIYVLPLYFPLTCLLAMSLKC